MTGWITAALALALCGTAFADDDEGRAKLIGNWQSASDTGAAWSLQNDGDSIRITHTEGGRKIAEFACNTLGKECAIKESGRDIKVSLWYNGPKLVEMEVHGSDVLKRRFSVAADGDTLDLEVIPISPNRKAETLHLKRINVSASRQ